MEEDILYEFRNIVEESRIEDNRDYYIKLRDTLDFMENLLTRNKQLEEENKSKQKAYDDCYCEYKHYKQFDSIPKSKVKDIIDRIDYDIKKTKEIISKNTNIYASYRKNDYQIVRLRAMNTKSLDIKNRLQKLLESEE